MQHVHMIKKSVKFKTRKVTYKTCWGSVNRETTKLANCPFCGEVNLRTNENYGMVLECKHYKKTDWKQRTFIFIEIIKPKRR